MKTNLKTISTSRIFNVRGNLFSGDTYKPYIIQIVVLICGRNQFTRAHKRCHTVTRVPLVLYVTPSFTQYPYGS